LDEKMRGMGGKPITEIIHPKGMERFTWREIERSTLDALEGAQ
jgi:hypothetical protein